MRIKLSETEIIWLRDDKTTILPLAAPLNQGVVSIIRAEGFEKKTRIKISVDQKLPFKIEQVINPPALLVTLYGVTENTEWIKLDYDDPLIGDIGWEQNAGNVCQVKINLNQQQHWGYNPFYEDGSLFIDIKNLLL